ncbi:hypothetical protein EV702DRAFT_1204689 [Suillus placidus]|uniref:Uncharacterized protein n=1 Tax=Suillus placidus TaxID=48579 RepID=A0A9P6ZHH8_9AGAM|nr:hypothetical protein EV702DRAFT_1204689 [Suillus placidus]
MTPPVSRANAAHQPSKWGLEKKFPPPTRLSLTDTTLVERLELLEDTPLEEFSAEERREHRVFGQILDSYPGLLERLKDGSEEEILHVGELHVFTSPSSVEREPKATQSGNARLHGMNAVTIPSVAYIATQVQLNITLRSQHGFHVRLKVRFALSSSSVFSQTDTTTDSETFYHSILDLLEDPEECQEVDDLLTWWNRQVFPTSSAAKRPISANSALSKIRQKCLALRQATDPDNESL